MAPLSHCPMEIPFRRAPNQASSQNFFIFAFASFGPALSEQADPCEDQNKRVTYDECVVKPRISEFYCLPIVVS